jgi:hypothetical protein
VTVYASGVAVTLDPDTVRLSTASLMAYRLRAAGFAAGRGGLEEPDFTTGTVPTLARADEVAARNAGLVSNDFPRADDDDEPELRTIAALRSAIQLEASAPNMDPERIRVWRDELRESVGRVGSGAGGDGAASAGDPLEAVWNFGGTCEHTPGSELPAVEYGELAYRPTTGIGRRLRW